MKPWDVVVIGGGPAGSATAALLARKGYAVLVVEKDRHPRFHIGESLLPRSRAVFDKLGVMPQLEARFLRKYAARFVDAETGRIRQYNFGEAFDTPYEYAFEVPRGEFDQILFEQARSCGVETIEGFTASDLLLREGRAAGIVGTRQNGEPETVEARFVVDASGRDSLLANGIVGKDPIPELPQTAMFTHYEGCWRGEGRDEGNIQIMLYRHGWWWFIPFRGTATSVGTVMLRSYSRGKGNRTNEEFLDETVKNTNFAREWLASARRTAPVRHTADWSYKARAFSGEGFALVGDAAVFLDPLFSTGVHLGLTGADLLAEAIDAGFKTGDLSPARFADYEARVRRASEFFLTFVRGFYDGDFRELVVDPNQRPTVTRLIVSVLSGDVFDDQARWISYLPDRYRPPWASAAQFA